MKKIYHLSSCSTCKKILSDWDPPTNVILQDIKKDPITAEELEVLRQSSGSYKALINKRATLFKERGLKTQPLAETDYKNLLLEHYTFLKRPVLITDKEIFAGNAKATVEAAKKAVHEQP